MEETLATAEDLLGDLAGIQPFVTEAVDLLEELRGAQNDHVRSPREGVVARVWAVVLIPLGAAASV